MTTPPALQKLLDRLGPTDQLDFVRLAEVIYESRFTGPTTIHWRNGVPQQIDLGPPIRLSIVQGLDSAAKPDSR